MQRNIMSVSWGDHLMFGEGDGRLDTPDAVRRRMERWRDDLDIGVVHWRMIKAKRISGRRHSGRGYKHPYAGRLPDIDWDDFETVPIVAHELGLQAYLHVYLFDEGWPLPPKRVRDVSYHNKWHCQHVSWESDFAREHHDWMVVDRHGGTRQMGVPCLAYDGVRDHFRRLFVNLIAGTQFDGLFICLRSQSRPADSADQFGFNQPVREDFLARYGKDILSEEFDLVAWRDLLGGYLTGFLGELRGDFRRLGKRLAVGAARGDVLGPPLGNTTLQWRRWVKEGLVDELIVNQNSSRCPSLWIDLWPMHRGTGYVQNYLNGINLPSLDAHLRESYRPVFEDQDARLYVARQWDNRAEAGERALLAEPAVSGLVYGSFRMDNPRPVARGNWSA